MEEIKNSNAALMTKDPEQNEQPKRDSDIPRTTIEMLEQTLQIA